MRPRSRSTAGPKPASATRRAALKRFVGDRGPLFFFRPDAKTNATLRRLHAGGAELAAFTDAPAELARVALAHLGLGQVAALESGEEPAVARLEPSTRIVRTRGELAELPPSIRAVERQRRPLDDRQLDVLLERLDGIRDELRTLNRRLDSQETLLRIASELSNLNESLQALAYAALGTQAPTVRRKRRTG